MDLDKLHSSLRKKVDRILVAGDFNCRLASDARLIYKDILGPFVYHDLLTLDNGYCVLSFARHSSLRVLNTYFGKKDIKLQTWQHPTGFKAMMDLILAPIGKKLVITNIQVSRKADANSDHFLLTFKTSA